MLHLARPLVDRVSALHLGAELVALGGEGGEFALKDAISTYDPARAETLVTAERQEAWRAALEGPTA